MYSSNTYINVLIFHLQDYISRVVGICLFPLKEISFVIPPQFHFAFLCRRANMGIHKCPVYTIVYDALPIPWRIQMWIQVENSERGRSQGTFFSS
jgi:hypothetical protein